MEVKVRFKLYFINAIGGNKNKTRLNLGKSKTEYKTGNSAYIPNK